MKHTEDFSLTEEQKIEMLVSFILDSKKYIKEFGKSYNSDTKLISHAYMCSLYGYEGFPTVLSDQDFKDFDGITLFRGNISNENNANLLADFDYHHGYGAACYGIYSSNTKIIAKSYAALKDKNVITFKIGKNIVNFNDLAQYIKCLFDNKEYSVFDLKNKNHITKIKKLKDYIKNLDAADHEDLFWSFALNRSLMAIYLGYDAIICDQNTTIAGVETEQTFNPLNYIILNRSAITISQSEFDRICNSSIKYKDGLINFDKKSAAQFLHQSDYKRKQRGEE